MLVMQARIAVYIGTVLLLLHLMRSARLAQAGTWTAVLDLAGEAYQAFFDSQAAALEALNAAGVGNKPMPLQQAAEVCAADWEAPFGSSSYPHAQCALGVSTMALMTVLMCFKASHASVFVQAAAAAAAAARYAGLPQGFGQTIGQPGASLTAVVPMAVQQLPVI